jgi:hypothetical protein
MRQVAVKWSTLVRRASGGYWSECGKGGRYGRSGQIVRHKALRRIASPAPAETSRQKQLRCWCAGAASRTHAWLLNGLQHRVAPSSQPASARPPGHQAIHQTQPHDCMAAVTSRCRSCETRSIQSMTKDAYHSLVPGLRPTSTKQQDIPEIPFRKQLLQWAAPMCQCATHSPHACHDMKNPHTTNTPLRKTNSPHELTDTRRAN